MFYPITFSMPEEKFSEFREKKKILSSLIPGVQSTYIYNTEENYYREYAESYFATTQKKAGWDCLRHYEILAQGSIPYFIDIEKCPKNTLALLPKDLLIEGNKMYEKFSKLNSLTEKDKLEYFNLRDKLFEFTKEHLTTTAMAKYILKTTSNEDVKKILYLSQDISPDYLRCLTLNGFKKLFGQECHDYPKIPHIYKCNDGWKYYGRGYSYTNILDYSLHNDKNDSDEIIKNQISTKYYDILIYGSYHIGMPFYNEVISKYSNNEIILLCGEDAHYCDYKNYNCHVF